MELSDKKINTYLLTIEGIGAAFIAVFLVAYLAGLPTTNVYHMDLPFRIPLAVLGLVLAFLALSGLVIASLRKD
jgi:hypothetical protein